MRHETALHRIQVLVLQLLDFLFLTPHIEILEPGLPELRERVVSTVEAQAQFRC